MSIDLRPTQIAQIITLGSALLGGAITIYIYYRNSRLRRMEWLYQLYDKFFFLDHYKKIRRIVDYARPEDLSRIRMAVTRTADFKDNDIELEEALVDFLNFFQFIASLWKLRQLRLREIQLMFKYYLCRIGDHPFLIEYLKNEGFEQLNDLIAEVRKPESNVLDYLFVYGTLRCGSDHSMFHFLSRYAEFVGHATYQGRLYKVDYYPGAIPSDNPNDIVHGEVYRLRQPNKVLVELDKFEECAPEYAEPTEYKRKQQNVRLSDGRIVSAWTYVYNRPVDGLDQITSGNFIQSDQQA